LAPGTQDRTANDERTFGREPEHFLTARALIALQRPAEAASLLEQLLLAAQAGGRGGRVIEIVALRALAFQALGNGTQALACLERALSLAEPEGYVRLFVDEGQPMERLLRQAASSGVATGYARKLLAAFVTPARETPPQPLVDPLSERELEVLRLLATNLSSTDIAQELTIAVSTVRSHTKSIYSKLDVHRRLDAVERAKELGLMK
jgi:LuxR family maltose regulon positive regulatory protein